ncbi:hypothetical protein Pmani_026666 [Petrolisthes manimaculis]|uniref:Uncharacterized protein n=1 Tax=Petrolisthes manimaculis TaxID=1843537 RepID=A0AAE1TWG0_9EUCA|nr:hypothetical protein Pmani_026666 [Petrolisthes manimaculis]
MRRDEKEKEKKEVEEGRGGEGKGGEGRRKDEEKERRGRGGRYFLGMIIRKDVKNDGLQAGRERESKESGGDEILRGVRSGGKLKGNKKGGEEGTREKRGKGKKASTSVASLEIKTLVHLPCCSGIAPYPGVNTLGNRNLTEEHL